VDSEPNLGQLPHIWERESPQRQPQSLDTVDQLEMAEDGQEDLHRRLYGPLANSFKCHSHSLIKKTIRIENFGSQCRLISYYRPVDVLQGRLKGPSMDEGKVEMMHMLHLERSLVPLGNLSMCHQVGENSGRSSIYPWDISTSTLIDSQPYQHTSNELDYDHCNVQQYALPFSGVVDMEFIPGPIMVSETRQWGLDLDSLWPVMEDLEGRGVL
jgi:hypothetical protein